MPKIVRRVEQKQTLQKLEVIRDGLFGKVRLKAVKILLGLKEVTWAKIW